MTVEPAEFVSDLIITSPPGTDLRAEGDDQLRLIKKVLRATFPEGERAFRFDKVVAKSAAYAVVEEDDQTLFLVDAAEAPVVITLPEPPFAGWRIWVAKVDSTGKKVTVLKTGDVKINGVNTFEIVSEFGLVVFWCDGENWFAGTGALSDPFVVPGTGAASGPSGTTAQRPDPAEEGMWRYNTDTHMLEYYNGDAWVSQESRVVEPGGRLTLITGRPVPGVDVVEANTVYYTSVGWNRVPVWNGTSFDTLGFGSDLVLALTAANHVEGGIYDVFAINDNVLKLATGPKWTNVSAGNGSRAGTPELSTRQGILVNANEIDMVNGVLEFDAVPAGEGTYLGSIMVGETAGKVSCHVGVGQNREWGVWNAYHRRRIVLQISDPTTDWTYSGALRMSRGSADNRGKVFCGLAEETARVDFRQRASFGGNGTNYTIAEGAIAVGVNGIVASGLVGTIGIMAVMDKTVSEVGAAMAVVAPKLGVMQVNCLEKGFVEAFSWPGDVSKFYGGVEDMLMTIEWMG